MSTRSARERFRPLVFVSLVVGLLWAVPSSLFATGPIAGFDWSMPDRFGLDEDGDGIVDIPNSAAYAQPSGFTVNFDGSPSAPGASPIVSYNWVVRGNG